MNNKIHSKTNLKRKCDKEFGKQKFEFYNSWGIFIRSKKEFGGKNEETIKVVELKKVEQESKTMEEFVQKFRRASRYKEILLIEEFEREINKTIRRKLIETKCPPRSIEQWYERAVNLDRHWRESK